MGVSFEVERIKIDEIDREESLNRQVRLGKKLNDDIVTSYAIAMESPDAVWPYCIVNRHKKQIFLWSGNHRIAAADLIGETEVDAYVVNVTDPRLQDIIPRLVNAMESPIGQKREESLVHAQWMIENHGMEPKDAAQLLGLRYEWIIQHMRGESIGNIVREEGVDSSVFPKSLLMRMAPLVNNRVVLRETAKFLKKHKVKGDEANRLVDDIKRTSTEAEASREIARWQKVFDDRLAKKPLPFKTKNRNRFLGILTGLHKFLMPIKKPGELQLESGEEAKVAKYWFEIKEKLDGLMKEGK